MLLTPMLIGQSSKGLAMDTLRRKDSMSEKCSITNFSLQDENIFTSTSHKTWIN
jgi:hypothetical protein